MPTDLTERLAAKLGTTVYPPRNWEVAPERVPFDTLASVAHQILPLLLSEPELVAGLAPEAKREVLRTLLGERLNAGVMDALTDLHTGATGYDVCEANREAVLNLLAPLEAP